MAKRSEAGYKTIKLGPPEQLDAIRANLSAFEDQQKKSELILLCCSNPTPVTMESEVVPCSCGRPEPGDVICRYCRSPVSERTRGCHVCGGRGVGFDGRPCPECNR